MADVLDGFEDGDDLVEEVAVDRGGEPLGPFGDVFGVGGAGDGGGDAGVLTGKLDGELCDIDAVVGAEFRGVAGGLFDVLGFLEPLGEFGVGEEAGGEGAGVHGTDFFRFEAGEEFGGEGGVLEGVAVVAEHAVDLILDVVEDGVEGFHRVAGKTDRAYFSLLLEFDESGQGFRPDLFERDELDIVEEHDVEVIGLEALEGNVGGFLNAFRGEIEMDVGVAAELRAEKVGIAWDSLQAEAEHDFRHTATVERGGIDEVHAEIEGSLGGEHGLIEGDGAELRAE